MSENADEEMEQNDNRDIDQALKDLEGSLGTTSITNKVFASIFHLYMSQVEAETEDILILIFHLLLQFCHVI